MRVSRIKTPNITIIEGNRIQTVSLDNKPIWTLGRQTPKAFPDISLKSSTVSRAHGQFQRMDGLWFYIDSYGKNGTYCNGRKLMPGLNGRAKPILMRDGDTLLLGCGHSMRPDEKSVWIRFADFQFQAEWRAFHTAHVPDCFIADQEKTVKVNDIRPGEAIEFRQGVAVRTESVTFLCGDIFIYK